MQVARPVPIIHLSRVARSPTMKFGTHPTEKNLACRRVGRFSQALAIVGLHSQMQVTVADCRLQIAAKAHRSATLASHTEITIGGGRSTANSFRTKNASLRSGTRQDFRAIQDDRLRSPKLLTSSATGKFSSNGLLTPNNQRHDKASDQTTAERGRKGFDRMALNARFRLVVGLPAPFGCGNIAFSDLIGCNARPSTSRADADHKSVVRMPTIDRNRFGGRQYP